MNPREIVERKRRMGVQFSGFWGTGGTATARSSNPMGR
jgi:hypothetical protein